MDLLLALEVVEGQLVSHARVALVAGKPGLLIELGGIGELVLLLHHKTHELQREKREEKMNEKE
jgi:hypothetical protein